MIEKVRFSPTWSLFDIHSLDSTVMLGLGIKLQSWRHHLNQCTAETKEILKVEDGDCCIFVLIENKIKSVEFDVWARSDSIQVVQSLSKAGGAENEAPADRKLFKFGEKKGNVYCSCPKSSGGSMKSHDMIFWSAAWSKDGFPLSSTVNFLNRIAEGLHCVWICFWEIYNLTRTVSNNSVLRHA